MVPPGRNWGRPGEVVSDAPEGSGGRQAGGLEGRQQARQGTDEQGGGQAARPSERGDDGGPPLGVGIDHTPWLGPAPPSG